MMLMMLACAQCAGLEPALPAGPSIPGCSVVIPSGGRVQDALSAAAPGTSICLEDGVYSPVRFTRSGTPGAWITLRAVHPGKAEIVALRQSADAVNLNGQSYLEIRDLVIDGGAFGIVSSGFAHHTRVAGCEIKFTAASGIQLNDGDYRIIEHNRVHDCAKGWSGSGSGISIYHPVAADHASGPHNVISYNLSYDNANPPGGTDGNGIIFDDGNHSQSDHYAYRETSLIEENIVYGNGGAGIQIFQSSHVIVRNNTAYWNHAVTTNSVGWRGELQDEYGAGIVWVNNIAWANPRFNRHNSAIVAAGDKSVWRNNLEYDGAHGANPKLANPPRDFTPLPGSPAIGTGTAAYGAPDSDFYGRAWDSTLGIGAVKQK
ncbi:MAG TPA: right-handed parallel beta-helix repeat-containing protein [Candidatus Binataceae bacterium]|nr:right-handed parallel beta-helix repeat-containing protein [Candidatus Binataceae bacterium]